MMKNWLSCMCVLLLAFSLIGCKDESRKVKIGVSLGVGPAARWRAEKDFMEERAKEIGADIEVRLNLGDKPKTQAEDCFEMLSDGIDVLIITPRNVRNVDEILTYAKQRNVKVISYARAVMGGSVELFIGYDCYKIGQSMGQHLTEKVYRGDIIILKGDADDFNTPLLYYGAMKYIKPLVESGDLKVVLDTHVPKWSPAEAKKRVKEAVAANGNHIDAILASNDLLAGAGAEALKELGVGNHVVITGMDAELAAVKRILAGTQDATVYMDLKELAYAAVDEAYSLATKNKVNVNSELVNDRTNKINAFLINGKVVTRENIDKVLIEPGHFTKEEVYPE
ncbi:substrate-binding domain-containing protein [uncultured Bilophila sp.]|uniref:sugar ABC transporter substrate-binding protein n=1 Tax=uncultured Bilophila sp. TaxID=529385 RepID=UPI00280ABF7A|nr:substrate-binding domain-containing protein [uncultured Bilophila sp.]